MRQPRPLLAIIAAGFAMTAAAAAAAPAVQSDMIPKATEKDWLQLSKLPDFSGVWTPNVSDQFAQVVNNVPPWTPKVAEQIKFLEQEEKEGRPLGILVGCLPHGMPTWMLINHNALEILMTPGRVTMLGEADGNRLRRIYTDGRGHPEDPDLTFHGHSVGRWEGDTLVVDTVGILPQAWIAVSEAVGVPNNGDMHITERIRLQTPDILAFEMEITAPKVLTKPWKTTRTYFRQRSRKYDIVEGVCVQGSAFNPGEDKHGNAIFVPVPLTADGSVVPVQ
jgi:hypothetical protein